MTTTTTTSPAPTRAATRSTIPVSLVGEPVPSDCCSGERAPVDAATAESMAARFKVLADPTRIRLLSHIAAQGCESVCACDLIEVVNLSQPTVSHHLKKLVEAGLLTREQRGKWAHYTVVASALDDLRGFLDLS
ncbi:ArsR/SmtB family transcription factor [Dietzia aerolata]|uniref:ArsR/SmtB family transcription factor n=1 Tax=Dietzia aerolata TaxID=595984 RepID=A0ABV5JU96_9ACTN|nr:metalloregulator ArsR/SmtB family transcription factor [Dietzia aerolata]